MIGDSQNEYTTDGVCWYKAHYSSGLGNSDGDKTWSIHITQEYNKIYQTTVTVHYSSKYNYLSNDMTTTASKLFNYLFRKHGKYSEVEVPFVLNPDLQHNKWYISNVDEDYCFGIFNSPSKMTIYYTNENNEELRFEYVLENSFQKIDNCNQLTRNKY